MAKFSNMTFTATGKGQFPIDMLRHDFCYPVGEESSYKIQQSESLIPRTVMLATTSKGMVQRKEPTIGRWESFGWTISDIQLMVG